MYGAWDPEREAPDPANCKHNWYRARYSNEDVCVRCHLRKEHEE